MQAFMLTIYNLFKEGMTKDDVESQLISQNIPYDYVQTAIGVVKKYMEEQGEWEEEPETEINFPQQEPQQEPQPSALRQQQDAQMESYEQQSMDAAMEDDDEFDEMLYRDNPYMGQQPSMQMGGPNPMSDPMSDPMNAQKESEPKDSSFTPYYPNIEFYGGEEEEEKEEVFKMKQGGKVSKKQFMKNVLNRFEPGGENVTLKSGPKKDNLDKDVEKATKGFVSAVQGTAKESLSKEMYKLAEQSGDPKLQQILMSGDQQQQPMQPMARRGMMVNGDDEPLLYGSKKTQPVNFIEGNTDLGIPYGSQTTMPVDGFEDNTDLKYAYGGMQIAEGGKIVNGKLTDVGGMTYEEYIKWYNQADPNAIPENDGKSPMLLEQEWNDENAPDKINYGRTVYKDRYEYGTSNQGYGIRDMLFPANRFMGYRPKYHVDPRLGKPVARDVYGKTLFGGKKYIDYYEMPDEDFDPEILRRKDINKRARQGNRFLRKALKGKLDYKDILNKTSTRRGNLDDAGNDMGVDAKKSRMSRRSEDTQSFLDDNQDWDQESFEGLSNRAQRVELQNYRFDQEDYNMRHRLNPNYEIENTKERPRIDGFKNKVRGAGQKILNKINPFKEIGGESLNKFVLGGFDPTETYKDPYAYNVEMDNPSDEMINSDIESFKGAQDAINGSDDEKRNFLE